MKPVLTFRPPVIAHRGARARAPENTLAAFQLAHEEGAVWIETDVKLTHDGVPILMHDDMLDRTTGGKGPVAGMAWADMQKLDAGSWFGAAYENERIPRLSEALEFVLAHNMRINLEIKPCPGRAQATTMVALIEAAKIWPKNKSPPLVSSFDSEALMIAAGLHPEWPRGLLLKEWREDWAQEARKTSTNTLHLNAKLLTKERLDMLMESRLPILAYTVNDPVRAKELLHWGVRAVFTDNPAELIKAL
jgi:glycerophosphoryl diester phosphodiesterase